MVGDVCSSPDRSSHSRADKAQRISLFPILMTSLYLKRFFSSLAGLLLSVVLFNFIVDPYGIYNWVSISGINYPKPMIEKNEKLAKAMLVSKVKPEAIILGSSRAEFGIDPNYSNWEVSPVFNLALAGVDTYLMNRYLQHAQALHPLKKVVIGLDFFTFNVRRPRAKDFQEENLAVGTSGKLNLSFRKKIFLKSLFTLSTTTSSFKTIFGAFSYSGQLIDSMTGLRKFSYKGQVIDLKDRTRTLAAQKKKAGGKYSPEKTGIHPRKKFIRNENLYIKYVYFSGPEHEYLLSDSKTHSSSLGDLQKIVQFCRQKHIALYLFISPPHARQMEVIRSIGLWPLFEQWKRELVKIAEEGSVGQEGWIPLWDFSGYNSVTSEDVPEAGVMTGYLDSSHYQPGIGDIILDKVLHDKQDSAINFGHKLTSTTIEDALALIRKEQKDYHETHPQDVQEVEGLARKSGIDLSKVVFIGGDRLIGARLGQ